MVFLISRPMSRSSLVRKKYRSPFRAISVSLSRRASDASAVHVDPIHAQRHQVVDGTWQLVDVADQEELLQHDGVERLECMVLGGLVDRALDRRVEEAFDRWVEPIERYQCADPLGAYLLGGPLKCVER